MFETIELENKLSQSESCCNKKEGASPVNLGVLNLERANLLSLINFNKNIIRAKGSYLYVNKDERYLDFTSQYGAVPFGHNPYFLWQEIISYYSKSSGIMIQPFQSKKSVMLAEELIRLAPGDMKHVTFGCTGAEAVEISFKMAASKTGRTKILSTNNSFHGKTMGAALATGNQYYSEIFYPPHENFSHVPFNDYEQLEKALSTKLFSAFIIEPIQGEGGMVEASKGYLKHCENLCNKYGTLLIVDEIQTGLGRTGTLFSCEKENIKPDILLVAKALSGGIFPISACIANERSWSSEFSKRHSSTFANNDLACSIAFKVLQKITGDRSVLSNINIIGSYLKESLIMLVKDFPGVFKKTSGQGLMQGISLMPWEESESYLICSAGESGYSVPIVSSYLLNEHKIFTVPTLNASDVLRIQPNYMVTKQEVDQLIFALRDVGRLIRNDSFEGIIRSTIGLPPIQSEKNNIRRVLKNNYPSPKGSKLGTFAFLIHPTSTRDIVESMPNGSIAYTKGEANRIVEWSNQLKSINSLASAACHIPAFPSKDSGYIEGWFISCPLLPQELIRLSKLKKMELLQSYIEVAKEKGANVIGLGAYTSIISRSGTSIADCGIPITTGNSYTALTVTNSIRKICDQKDRKLGGQHLAVVGASGSVGRLAALDLGPECARISLIGNIKNKSNTTKLESVAGELLIEIFTGGHSEKRVPLQKELELGGITKKFITGLTQAGNSVSPRDVYLKAQREFFLNKKIDCTFPIEPTNDIKNQLIKCNVVITATSNGEAFLSSELFAPNAIVCDAARPSDLKDQVKGLREDVTIYEGGLVDLPEKIRLGGANLVDLPTGVSLACLSEAMILTMEQVGTNFSLGGTSTLKEAREIYQWGSQHGFSTNLPAVIQTKKQFKKKEI